MMKPKDIDTGVANSRIRIRTTVREQLGERRRQLAMHPDMRLIVGNDRICEPWRFQQNDLDIAHSSVWSMHALLSWKDGALKIAPVCGAPTFVNGELIRRGEDRSIGATDIVRFGVIEVIFHCFDPDQTGSRAFPVAA